MWVVCISSSLTCHLSTGLHQRDLNSMNSLSILLIVRSCVTIFRLSRRRLRTIYSSCLLQVLWGRHQRHQNTFVVNGSTQGQPRTKWFKKWTSRPRSSRNFYGNSIKRSLHKVPTAQSPGFVKIPRTNTHNSKRKMPIKYDKQKTIH